MPFYVGQPSDFTGPVKMWWCMLPGNVCLVLELYLRAEGVVFHQSLADVLCSSKF
jgi:hypothetical protein